jgi:hypothetical protein
MKGHKTNNLFYQTRGARSVPGDHLVEFFAKNNFRLENKLAAGSDAVAGARLPFDDFA